MNDTLPSQNPSLFEKSRDDRATLDNDKLEMIKSSRLDTISKLAHELDGLFSVDMK